MNEQNIYLWIDPNPAFVNLPQTTLINEYSNFTLTVDISNATNQNDNCYIYLFNDTFPVIEWITSGNSSNSWIQTLSVSGYDNEFTTSVEVTTNSFSPIIEYYNNAIYWYGDTPNTLLAYIPNINIVGFNGTIQSISANLNFNSGSIEININNYDIGQFVINDLIIALVIFFVFVTMLTLVKIISKKIGR